MTDDGRKPAAAPEPVYLDGLDELGAALAEKEAQGFEDPEEETSPEVVSAPQGQQAHSDPLAVVCTPDMALRKNLVKVLNENGWHAAEVKTVEELIDTCRAISPEVVLVDSQMTADGGRSIPEVVAEHRPDVARRVVALLGGVGSAVVASAVAEGYDDFIMDPSNSVEVLARTTSNLRAARALGEVQHQRRDAATLLELSQTLASSLDLQLILHTVSRLIAEVIKLERCSIIILDPDNDDAVMVAASEDRTVRDLRISLRNYPELQRVVSRAAPVIIEDAMQDPILDRVREKTSGVRMMALFPIVFEERVTGVLFLRSHRVSRQLTDHEVQFGQTVASACAVAIRNARLFDNFRDQTERINYMRMVAEKQMEALKKYEDFFEYAADGMAIVDSDAEVLYVNREGRNLLGRDREQLRGIRFTELLAPESIETWDEVVESVRRGRFAEVLDLYVMRGEGQERIFSASAGGGGQEMGLIILSFRDVTETREMEMELRTTKDFLENLIDNSVDAIVAADMSGNVMLFNKGAEKIYGHRAEDVIGRLHVSELYPDRVAVEIMRQLRDDRWGGIGKLEAQRKFIRNHDSHVVPVSMTASIIYEDGEEVATVGVFTDLRERIRIEKQLNDAQSELMKTEKARVAAELAGMAAHELNQPLTSVLGYAEMLRHKVPDTQGKVRKHIDTIYAQAERMAEIVRKIGKITKYETTHYTASTMMMDLEKSIGEGEVEPDLARRPTDPRLTNPARVPEHGRTGQKTLEKGIRREDVQRAMAHQATSSPTPELEEPSRQAQSAGILAALAKGSATASRAAHHGDDPRAAVVQLDTISEEPQARPVVVGDELDDDDSLDRRDTGELTGAMRASPGPKKGGSNKAGSPKAGAGNGGSKRQNSSRSRPEDGLPDRSENKHISGDVPHHERAAHPRAATSPGRPQPLPDSQEEHGEPTNPGVRIADLKAAKQAKEAQKAREAAQAKGRKS